MPRLARLLALPILNMTFASALEGQTRMPPEAIAHLRPFVGRWTVHQVLSRPSGRADTTHLESLIEFSADSSGRSRG
jgi:hypothetical protein